MTGASLSRADVDAFRAAVLAAPGPVVAHCRSGTRSLTLWVIGEVLAGRLSRADLLGYGQERGIDLTAARALARRARRLSRASALAAQPSVEGVVVQAG